MRKGSKDFCLEVEIEDCFARLGAEGSILLRRWISWIMYYC